MKVTIREVAKAANVSTGTVSRVLNGHGSVDPASADRVRVAVRSTNYRKLRHRASRRADNRSLDGKLIALVLLGMDRSLESLPSVAAAIQGAEAALSVQGATALLVSVPDPSQLPTVLRRERIEGAILKGALQGDLRSACSEELLHRLDSLPKVWLLGRPPGFCGDVVNPCDTQIGELAARHLAQRGHRRVAFLNPKPDHLLMRVRQMSFEWHAKALGMEVRQFLGQSNAANEFPLKPVQGTEPVQALVDALLASHATAVFVPADSIAVMVYRALAARGLQVGKDLSVLSCNHELPLLAGLYPSLSSISVHADEIGRRAVAQLSARLSSSADPTPLEMQLDSELIEGDSVACLELAIQ